jgi:hypothetical protein
MKKNKFIKIGKIFPFLIISLILVIPAFQVLGNNYQNIITNEEIGSWRINVDIVNQEEELYNGYLRIYIVEPESRWIMENGDPYHYSFLDFAVNEEISIDDSYNKNVTWNPNQADGIDEENLMVIAAIFNSTSYERFSYVNHPFDAYFVDAAAGAIPDSIGYNKVTNEFSHTVFIEEGTATWCPACPYAANALNRIYNSGDYPFYFVSLVSDENKDAQRRLSEDYNIYAIPVTFFDGGYNVYIGSSNAENEFRNRIESCGQREVPNLNLSISFKWDPDVAPPIVEIKKPINGLYLFNEKVRNLSIPLIIGSLNIEVSAYDNEFLVDYVEFYINGEKRKTDSLSPYRFTNWVEKGLFGKYTIKAIAYDTAGNQNSDEIIVWKFL